MHVLCWSILVHIKIDESNLAIHIPKNLKYKHEILSILKWHRYNSIL